MLIDRMKNREDCLLNHAGYFVCEVVFSLLKPFALFKANERGYLDVAAECLGGVLDILADGDVAVLDISLVEKADFLVVLVDTTGNDLFQNVRGLLGVLGIVAELLGENRFLLVNDLSRCSTTSL